MSTVCAIYSLTGGSPVPIGKAQALNLAARARALRRQGRTEAEISADLKIAEKSITTVLKVATKLGGEAAPPPVKEEASPARKPPAVRNAPVRRDARPVETPAAAASQGKRRAPQDALRDAPLRGASQGEGAALKKISALTFTGPVKRDLYGAGKRPYLAEIPLKKLRVETAYQRVIAARGAANVKAIVQDFRWSRFAPLIVAPIDDDGEEAFAIIDGQHRATALACLKIETAPAIVHEIDLAARADAFAAINVAVTAMTAQAKFYAQVATGDDTAATVAAIADSLGVDILGYNAGKKQMTGRQCVCVGALMDALRRYGAATLRTTLHVIVSRRTYRPGDIDARTVTGLSAALDKVPATRLPDIIRRADAIDFEAAYAAAVTRGRAEGVSGAKAFADFLKGALRDE